MGYSNATREHIIRDISGAKTRIEREEKFIAELEGLLTERDAAEAASIVALPTPKPRKKSNRKTAKKAAKKRR